MKKFTSFIKESKESIKALEEGVMQGPYGKAAVDILSAHKNAPYSVKNKIGSMIHDMDDGEDEAESFQRHKEHFGAHADSIKAILKKHNIVTEAHIAADLTPNKEGHDASTTYTPRSGGERQFFNSHMIQKVKHPVAKDHQFEGSLRKIMEGKNHTIEAHGVKGMKSVRWRKTFKNADHLNKWAEDNDAEVHATRDLKGVSDKKNIRESSREEGHFGDHIGLFDYTNSGEHPDAKENMHLKHAAHAIKYGDKDNLNSIYKSVGHDGRSAIRAYLNLNGRRALNVFPNVSFEDDIRYQNKSIKEGFSEYKTIDEMFPNVGFGTTGTSKADKEYVKRARARLNSQKNKNTKDKVNSQKSLEEGYSVNFNSLGDPETEQSTKEAHFHAIRWHNDKIDHYASRKDQSTGNNYTIIEKHRAKIQHHLNAIKTTKSFYEDVKSDIDEAYHVVFNDDTNHPEEKQPSKEAHRAAARFHQNIASNVQRNMPSRSAEYAHNEMQKVYHHHDMKAIHHEIEAKNIVDKSSDGNFQLTPVKEQHQHTIQEGFNVVYNDVTRNPEMKQPSKEAHEMAARWHNAIHSHLSKVKIKEFHPSVRDSISNERESHLSLATHHEKAAADFPKQRIEFLKKITESSLSENIKAKDKKSNKAPSKSSRLKATFRRK